MNEQTAPLVTYKGFDQDMKCRGFQYAVGQSYEHEGEVKACEVGFHACEHPLNVFKYYAPAGSRFAVVEQAGVISRSGDDTKVASSKITIKASIDIAGLVKATMEYVSSRCTPIDPKSPASATGYQGAASATGNWGAASATGDRGAASATGNWGAASATGNWGAASATGNQGAASATGNQGAASATGENSVSMAAGFFGKAMGEQGCAIVLVNRFDDGLIRHIRASKVGENGIKPGVFYILDDAGEFVEVAS
jgi:hypothetical protein